MHRLKRLWQVIVKWGKERRNQIAALLGTALILTVAYIGMGLYFQNRFYYHTYINGLDCSALTVKQVEQLLGEEAKAYELSVEGRNNLIQSISAEELVYRYVTDGSIYQLLDEKREGNWIWSLTHESAYEVETKTVYNEKAFEAVFQELTFLEEENMVEPVSAYAAYIDGKYQIVGEEKGSVIEASMLYEKLQEAILEGRDSLLLDEAKCYALPEYTADSEQLKNLVTELNLYAGAVISYDFEDEKEVLNGEVIHEWLSYNDNLEVTLDQVKVEEYVAELANKYNSYNLPRDFVTNDGTTVQVKATLYGWQINQEEEVKRLMEDILSGTQTFRDPAYSHTAVSHLNSDLGITYVEIDLTNQHLWFYKNGVEIVSTDVVTGNVSAGHTTPGGTYTLNYKQRDTILRGQDYASPVQYWMPFNGGIGLHDANWRTTFGGDIYKYAGSHGCINMPTQAAAKVFEEIEAGTPIICYYR